MSGAGKGEKPRAKSDFNFARATKLPAEAGKPALLDALYGDLGSDVPTLNKIAAAVIGEQNDAHRKKTGNTDLERLDMQNNSWRKATLLQAVFLFALGIFVPVAQGQAVYGSIFGTVTDNTGAVIPNATVTVTDVAKGTSVTAQTSGDGQYRVQHLIPDTYRVDVDAPGFTRSTSDNVVVYADTSPKVDLKMAVGSTSNTVTVTGAAPILQTDRADVSTILNARAVSDLPNLERNFTEFELLTPGTTYIGWSVGQATNPQQSEQIEVNGQLPFATGYQLDGTDNQDPIQGVAVINPNLDAVSEMKVTSQNYDAEFGQRRRRAGNRADQIGQQWPSWVGVRVSPLGCAAGPRPVYPAHPGLHSILCTQPVWRGDRRSNQER